MVKVISQFSSTLSHDIFVYYILFYLILSRDVRSPAIKFSYLFLVSTSVLNCPVLPWPIFSVLFYFILCHFTLFYSVWFYFTLSATKLTGGKVALHHRGDINILLCGDPGLSTVSLSFLSLSYTSSFFLSFSFLASPILFIY